MEIAVVQMEIADANPEKNRETLTDLLDQNAGSDLYLLPELWSTGYTQLLWSKLAEEDTYVNMSWMAGQARIRNQWIGGSIIAVNSDGAIVNRFLLFNRKGILACQYDKVHLFRPLQEDIYLKAGNSLSPIIDIDGVRFAPAICYDLRFPEMFRNLAMQGVDVFLVSSEWPFPREHALRVLVEARCIENQAFVALSNRIGLDGSGNNFCGGSGIFSPMGVIAEAGSMPGVVKMDIDIDELRKLRESFPCLSHRIKGVDFE